MYSNPIIKLNGYSKASFEVALDFAHRENRTVAYTFDDKQFVLYWTDDEDAKSLKLPPNVPSIVVGSIVWAWLQEVKYPEEPDHDGDNKEGWLVMSARHEPSVSWKAHIVIKPHWIQYGK